jgi:hypothetical protein
MAAVDLHKYSLAAEVKEGNTQRTRDLAGSSAILQLLGDTRDRAFSATICSSVTSGGVEGAGNGARRLRRSGRPLYHRRQAQRPIG